MTPDDRRADFAARASDISRAMVTIAQRRDAEGITQGTIACPRCGGSLSYRINPVGMRRSGSGRCATAGCLEWMS